MMWGTVLWLVVLAALAIVAVIVIRRVSSLAGSTHELDGLQDDVRGIDTRLDAIVEPLVVQLDAHRRGSGDPAALAETVAAAREALRTLAIEARALRSPVTIADRIAQLVGELDRAVRAVELVAHGLRAPANRRTSLGQESQVALKRGTLGLRHAREAAARIVAGITRLTPADLRAMPPPRLGAPVLVPPLPPEDEVLAGAVEEDPPEA